jgi:hypothetical protein
MRKFSIRYKIVALALALTFVFQTMETINSHTYGTGIYNIHSNHSCIVIGYSVHMNFNCTY